jgi:hypothetical protein
MGGGIGEGNPGNDSGAIDLKTVSGETASPFFTGFHMTPARPPRGLAG